MAVKRDYYEILGVGRTSTEDEIRTAFRRLARQYHPDISKEQGTEARFKEINEAYEILSNSDKRRSYDTFGHAGPSVGPGAGGFGIEDIFESFFGGGGVRGGRRVVRGADLQYDLSVTFEEAVFGTTRRIEIPRTVPCGRCSGDGSEPGSTPERCSQCHGAGETRRVQRSVFGQVVNVTVCDRCRGAGRVITRPCADCQGRGQVRHAREIPLQIPPGVDDGQPIQMGGEGELGANGGPPGDLYVVIRVKPHAAFSRSGEDILSEVRVNIAQAALGDEIEIPIIDGSTRIRVPAGTQSGRLIRVRGKGVPHLRGVGRGDHQAHIVVETPVHLTDRQRDLINALAATFRGEGPEPAAQAPPGVSAEPRRKGRKGGEKPKGLLDRMKDVLGGE